MARYSSRYGSRSRCFSEEYGWNSYNSANYAHIIIFMLVFLGLLVTLCIFRRTTGPGKRLIGLPYIFALSLYFVLYVIAFIRSTLSACQVGLTDMETFYDLNIAQTVLSNVATLLFLFVFIYTLNSMLRKQLGHLPSVLKVPLAIVLAVIGVLIVVQTILHAITLYYSAHYGWDVNVDVTSIGLASLWLTLATDIIILISVLGSGALSISAAHSLKKKHVANKSLMIWITVLVLCVVGFAATNLAGSIQSLPLFMRFKVDYAGEIAKGWLSAFFNTLAFLSLLMIAKNTVWRSQKSDTVMVEEDYAYNSAQHPHGDDYPQPPTAYGGTGRHA